MLAINWWYARRENEMEIIAGILSGGVVGTLIWFAKDMELVQIKRENERLNSELKRLTDRDSRGRFKGGK